MLRAPLRSSCGKANGLCRGASVSSRVSAEHGKEERVPCFGDEGGLSHSSSGVSFEAIRAL